MFDSWPIYVSEEDYGDTNEGGNELAVFGEDGLDSFRTHVHECQTANEYCLCGSVEVCRKDFCEAKKMIFAAAYCRVGIMVAVGGLGEVDEVEIGAAGWELTAEVLKVPDSMCHGWMFT